MDQNKFQTQAETSDEKFLSEDIIKYTKIFTFYALILLILTYICIWGVNYQKDSVFSTTTGKIESVK